MLGLCVSNIVTLPLGATFCGNHADSRVLSCDLGFAVQGSEFCGTQRSMKIGMFPMAALL